MPPDPPKTPNPGTLSVNALLSPTALPAIVSEWAALIPLVIHLANSQQDHQIAGEAALMGGLSVGLFPRLGTLDGISRLLYDGPEFLDRVGAMGDMSSVVWDVNWGSVFPCVNGAASAMVRSFMQRNMKSVRMPESIPLATEPVKQEDSPESNETPQLGNSPARGCQYIRQESSSAAGFRRYQTLNVFKFGRRTVKPSWKHRVLLLPPLWLTTAFSFVELGAAAVLVLTGIYGTAVIVVAGVVSQIACYFLQLKRPSLYLNNNETHDACMLVAAHENSSTWWLYIGDRGVVDSLLNKPMITLPSSSRKLSHWFKVAHVVQLLAVTYVAAQKGWDGVCLLILILAVFLIRWPYRDHQIGRRWLDREGITANAKSFQFSGRTQMVGAIHVFSGTRVTTWMDAIIAPSPRRQVWLQRLSGIDAAPQVSDLGQSDRNWVALHSRLAIEAARVLQLEMGGAGGVGIWGHASQPGSLTSPGLRACRDPVAVGERPHDRV